VARGNRADGWRGAGGRAGAISGRDRAQRVRGPTGDRIGGEPSRRRERVRGRAGRPVGAGAGVFGAGAGAAQTRRGAARDAGGGTRAADLGGAADGGAQSRGSAHGADTRCGAGAGDRGRDLGRAAGSVGGLPAGIGGMHHGDGVPDRTCRHAASVSPAPHFPAACRRHGTPRPDRVRLSASALRSLRRGSRFSGRRLRTPRTVGRAAGTGSASRRFVAPGGSPASLAPVGYRASGLRRWLVPLAQRRAGAPLCDRLVARAVHTDERRICAPSESTASRRNAGRSSPSGRSLSFTDTAAWRHAGRVSRYGAVSKLFAFLGASLGSAVGWWLGVRGGIMTGFFASMVGVGVGMYAGVCIGGVL